MNRWQAELATLSQKGGNPVTQTHWKLKHYITINKNYHNKITALKPSVMNYWHYENMPIQIYWKFHHQKTQNFSDKNSVIFHISSQNIDCGYSLEPPRRGGSNEYPQSMFLSRNKKNKVYPCKPQFYYIKVGFKGSKLYRYVFVMAKQLYRS